MTAVTYAVMAHPDRRPWALELSAELGDAPIAWAGPPWATRTDWTPVWRTRRAALELAGDARFHCIVQDDAILAPEFTARVERLVAAGTYIYGLFWRQKRAYPELSRAARRAEARGFFETKRGPILGVGLVLPTHWIEDLVACGDRDDATDGDDDRIRRWQRARGHRIYFPIPSLVDHRRAPSLIGSHFERVAWRFAS